jgi:Mg-chelatase subunit ChlD
MMRSTWSLLRSRARGRASTVLLCAAVVGCASEGRLSDPFAADVDGGDGMGAAGGSGSGGVFSGGAYNGSNAFGGGLCMSNTVQSGRVAPEILIVLDRSLSMGQEMRWAPSVAGIKQITMDLQNRVSFGLMTFPGTSGGGGGGGRGGGGNLTCGAGTVNVQIGTNSAGAIANALNGMQPGGATPTAVTLAAASAFYAERKVDPDTVPAPQYVLLVTDGAPNCTDGQPPMGGMSTATGSQEPAQVDASVDAIKAMTKAGVKTFVLGYDTQNDATLKGALDRMAQAGGTGDNTHRAVENQQTLVDQFRKITEVAIGCDFALDGPVSNKKYVLVKLDGKQINVDTADGWELSSDRRTVTVVGKSCETLKTEGHRVTVSVECDEVGTVY